MSIVARAVVAQALSLCGKAQPPISYTTTVQSAVDAALACLNLDSAYGQTDSVAATRYYSIAVPIVNELAAEILTHENPVAVYSPIGALTDVLCISDDSALRVLPIGIAMRFVEGDSDVSSYNALSAEYYNEKLPSIHAVSTGSNNKYLSVAVAYLNLLQSTLYPLENDNGLVPQVSSLDDSLSVSDDIALRVMSLGLAMNFAMLDGDTALQTAFSNAYASAKQAIKAPQVSITDVYGSSTDSDLTEGA